MGRVQPNAKLRKIRYLHVDEFEETSVRLSRFPFLKRIGFRDEDEVRLILEDTEIVRNVASLPFDLNIIEEIKLSPWLAKPLVDTVIETLADAYSGPKSEWERIKISHSSLLENRRVIGAGGSAG